jgi:hypothetical protein
MKSLILIAGALAFGATAAPAMAHPGNGHGKATHAKSTKSTLHGRSAHGAKVTGTRGRLLAFEANGRCPPGLAKRNNGCMAPGQVKKVYRVGQRYNRNFGTTWSYNQVPEAMRTQYDLDQSDRYYYRNGYLYQVDPQTMLVQQVISALLR